VGDISPRGRDIVNQTKLITRLLALGATVAIVIIVVRITASDNKIKLPGDIKVPITDAWLILVALTACHIFLTVFLVRQTHLVWRDPAAAEEGADIVREVKADGNIFVSGLEVKVERRRRLYIRSAWDQSIWVAYLAALLLFAAVLPWGLDHGHLRWSSGAALGAFIALAVALTVLNWLAGGTWVVALIELAMPKASANYHRGLDRSFYSGQEIPIDDALPSDDNPT
jgi:hypothetical protein